MMCKDSKMVSKDDYGNLETLGELPKETRILLMEANGLRNHLVHRYNRMDDLLALESMKRFCFRELPPSLRRWRHGSR
jgi:uncharacterized protein YutE (UPF0331/DUF86 family)